jgi:5'-3' exonuclease
MGLPGFFAWILKKFAREILHNKLNNNVKYLYIDANCLFHPECFKILEGFQNDELEELKKKMFKRIINYLDYLEKYVSPTKMMYIAVDGTAPLAKIIQQRKRRYKTELDNFTKNELKLKYGININNEWSNTSITPGTTFMEDLHKYLINHYNKKKSKIKFIYSSYHTPGEGEHKILQHIKKNTNIDDNIVIYGLDADLIFLAMASNRTNIFLLREETLFKQKNNINKDIDKDIDKDINKDINKDTDKNIKPYDYINDVHRDMTFVSIKEMKISYNKEIKQMVGNNKNFDNVDFSNDLIFICFLLGNDFLPHFPSIDIHQEGLDELINSYIKNLLIINYSLINREIDKNGETVNIDINMQFFCMIIEDMGKKEENFFRYKLRSSNERYNRKKCYEEDQYKQEIWQIDNLKNQQIHDKIQLGVDNKDVWKYRYYEHHFKLTGNQTKFVENLVLMYLNGIKWVTQYYFQECPDWRWNYMCHHAPFISDMATYIKKYNFDLNNVKIINRKHIPMMSQLISVLPPSCKHYLPESYKDLITDFNSPIIDMFPTNVQVDMLYKYQLYQCIPLVPFLDIDRVLEATNNKKLSKAEADRALIIGDYYF